MDLTEEVTSPSPEAAEISKVALLVAEASQRRLLEGVASHLHLRPQALDIESLQGAELLRYELILADEALGTRIRSLLKVGQRTAPRLQPSLIAITGRSLDEFRDDSGTFDAVLSIPASSNELAARLGVALYAHRSFAARYQPSLEELDLNRSIFRSVTNGISVADAREPDLPLLYVNPAFELITGYSLEESVGRNCRFLQRGEDAQPGLTLIREALREGRETRVTLRNYRKDGTLFWNELSLSPIRNHTGELTHFVGIQNDVTERVEFEKALRESEKLAAVGRLASSIAHEINNPLEAVTNLVYLARHTAEGEPIDDESSNYLRQAEEELQRIKLITAQSLRFSHQSTSPEAVTCDDLVTSVLDLYKARLANYHLQPNVRLRATEHVAVLVSEIRQVLSNLVANAIDAMKGLNGTLYLRTREATEWRSGARGVLLPIADTGRGMPAAVRENIYKVFFTTKGAAGTGLGLWISSEIVARHRGSLRVRTRQMGNGTPHGTVFQLFLPYQGVEGEQLASLASLSGKPSQLG